MEEEEEEQQQQQQQQQQQKEYLGLPSLWTPMRVPPIS